MEVGQRGSPLRSFLQDWAAGETLEPGLAQGTEDEKNQLEAPVATEAQTMAERAVSRFASLLGRHRPPVTSASSVDQP